MTARQMPPPPTLCPGTWYDVAHRKLVLCGCQSPAGSRWRLWSSLLTRTHWMQKSWDFLEQRIPSKLQDESGKKKASSLPPSFGLEQQSTVKLCREKRNSLTFSRKGWNFLTGREVGLLCRSFHLQGGSWSVAASEDLESRNWEPLSLTEPQFPHL